MACRTSALGSQGSSPLPLSELFGPNQTRAMARSEKWGSFSASSRPSGGGTYLFLALLYSGTPHSALSRATLAVSTQAKL